MLLGHRLWHIRLGVGSAVSHSFCLRENTHPL